MTAQSTLIPGEDAEEFLARQKELLDDLQPRNRLEEIMIERIARDDWMSIRAERAAAAQVALRLRYDATNQTREERHEAIELGEGLLCRVAFPLPLPSPLPSSPDDGAGAPPSRSARSKTGRLALPSSPHDGEGSPVQAPVASIPGDPNHPARLLLRLESTLTGCEWLLDRWAGLKERLECPGLWQMEEGFEMIRLMGGYAIDMARSYNVQFLLLANLCVAEENEPVQIESEGYSEDDFYRMIGWDEPDPRGTDRNKPPDSLIDPSKAQLPPSTPERTFGKWHDGKWHDGKLYLESPAGVAEIIADTRERIREWLEPFQPSLEKQPLMGRLAPANVEEARNRLSVAIEERINLLKPILKEHQRLAALDAAEAPARLAFETGADGDRQRRYVLSRDRLLNRTVDTFLKVRQNTDDGVLEHVDFDPDDGIDPDDPTNMENPDHADEPSGSDPFEDIGPVGPCDARDSFDAPAEVEVDVFEQVDDEEEQRQESSASDSPQLPPAQSSRQEASCDDECILRNEATSHVSHHGEDREQSENHSDGVDIGSGAPYVAGGSAKVPVEAVDVGSGDATSPDLGEPPRLRSPISEAGCDDASIFQNEANEPVLDRRRLETHKEIETVEQREPPGLLDEPGKDPGLIRVEGQRERTRFPPVH